MLDLEQLRTLAQQLDNLDSIAVKMEKSYSENDAEDFNRANKEMIKVQNKINEILILGGAK